LLFHILLEECETFHEIAILQDMPDSRLILSFS